MEIIVPVTKDRALDLYFISVSHFSAFSTGG